MREVPSAVRAVKITPELRPGWENELNKVLSLALVDSVVHFHEIDSEHLHHAGKTILCQFTVWDYIAPGENLRAYLARVRKIDAGFVFAVVERILHVLHACEAQGISRHGDLHSGNILIGDQSRAVLDESLQPRAPIYVSDFGYGTTGGAKQPKEDYRGLAQIINEMLPRVDYAKATATHRQMLRALRMDFGKLLNDGLSPERQSPLNLLKFIANMKRAAQGGQQNRVRADIETKSIENFVVENTTVGQFQVSEMIGDRWDWWRKLFVPTAPARSKILALDIPTVVTGPRGCGKTMLFRRLSERLIVECGDVDELKIQDRFVALYVNANDLADAFAAFPDEPTPEDESRLICYANLCVLSELLSVQSARAGKFQEPAPDSLLSLIQEWIVPETYNVLLVGEDRLERYRAIIEQIKWSFPGSTSQQLFPGYGELAQHRWLPRFVQLARDCCSWMGKRPFLLFVDDFSTPRVSTSMQRVLNRLFLQRSPSFLAKVATEAWTTFVPEDSSGKNLQDGDDYQLVDMGEESLFLPDEERLSFLDAVFSRRLAEDSRIPDGCDSLYKLLGRLRLSKTEFARRLRTSLKDGGLPDAPVSGSSQRRGRAKGRVQYFGDNVFANLWSGDTRTMIQLATDVIDQAGEASFRPILAPRITVPIDPAIQDRALRNRGGEWLNSHTRNEPTNFAAVTEGIAVIQATDAAYRLSGTYGDHLKAIVEAFVSAANRLLLGPVYTIRDGDRMREVPRMAFRIEIIDEFRIDGLAQELYRDLIRYGLFMRDNRGKSVRGAFVPRLYLRRLLLPFATLALSKRDSVPLSCAHFLEMLLRPDEFKQAFNVRKSSGNQLTMPFDAVEPEAGDIDSAYDDIDEADSNEQQGEEGREGL
jgi:hypothetical protein